MGQAILREKEFHSCAHSGARDFAQAIKPESIPSSPPGSTITCRHPSAAAASAIRSIVTAASIALALVCALAPVIWLFGLLELLGYGIDPLSISDIRHLVKDLKQRGIGVLITDHNVRETLGICDRAYIVNEGKVFASGSPEEIIHNDSVREVYLGKDFRL